MIISSYYSNQIKSTYDLKLTNTHKPAISMHNQIKHVHNQVSL